MSALWLLIILVALLRLAELTYAGRNTKRLLAEGGIEAGAGHYPLIVGLHVAWLASMALNVPPEQGQIIMPPVKCEPLAIGASKSWKW